MYLNFYSFRYFNIIQTPTLLALYISEFGNASVASSQLTTLS